MQREIGFTQILGLLENQPVPEKMPVFVDTTTNVERFLTYKGQVFDINKMDLGQKLGKIKESDLDKDIRQRLLYCLKAGEKAALFLDQAVSFNLIEFFTQFKWFDKSTFFNVKDNLLKRDYVLKQGMLKEKDKEEDVDMLGNIGFWEGREEKARVIVLINGQKDDLEKIKPNFPEEYFEIIVIK